MAVSRKDRNYIRDFGSTKSVRQLARELALSRDEVRQVLEELKQKGELKSEAPHPRLPILYEKSALSKTDYLWAAITAVSSFAVYLLTLAPDITGEDSGELITAAYTLGICHPPGYPLWCILGKLFTIIIPFGTIAYRVNFMSAFFAAWTIFFLFLVIRKITGNRIIAASASLVFAFSYEFWSQTTIAEVYTLDTFFVTASLLTILVWDENRSKRFLYVLALLCGLGCTNHHTMGPISLVFAGYVLLKARRGQINLKVVGICALLFTAMLSVYLYLPIRARANPYMNWGNPATMKNFLNHVMRAQYQKPAAEIYSHPFTEPGHITVHNWERFWRQIGIYGSEYVRQFRWFLFWLPILGLWAHLHRRKLDFFFFFSIFLLTSLGFIIYVDFNPERESIIFKDFLFIPSYIIATLWLGVALHWLLKALVNKTNWKWAHIGAPAAMLLLPTVNLFGNYYENDKSRYYFAIDYGNAIFDSMEEKAIIVPDLDHRIFTLLYFQGVLGMRPDVTIANKYGCIEEDLYRELIKKAEEAGKRDEIIPREKIEEHIILKNQNRPVYFPNAPIPSLPAEFAEVPEGLLFRVVRKADLPKYQKKVSGEYWKRYRFRNFGDARVARDLSADMIIIDYHYMRALSYYEEGKKREALQEIDKLRESAEGLKYLLNNLGNTLAMWGLYKEAIEFYEKALSCNPYYLNALCNAAKTYLLLKDYENCLKYLNRAFQVDPNHLDSQVIFAQMCIAKGKFDEAIYRLESIIGRSPGYFLPYRLLGFIYLNAKKDVGKASELFRKSLELNPNQADVRQLLQ
jgi:tetratricopeptide (TPR) repeat protein